MSRLELARRLLGDDAVVGLSTHAPGEVIASSSTNRSTTCRPARSSRHRPNRGAMEPESTTSLWRSHEAGRPVFVTGGVSPETVPELAAAGARHFVVVRYLTEADEPRRAARELRDAIDRVLERPDQSALEQI